MIPEDRLRQLLRHDAEGFEPDPDALSRIHRRVRARRRRRLAGQVGVPLALAAALAAGLVTSLPGGARPAEQYLSTGPRGRTTTTLTPTTLTPTTLTPGSVGPAYVPANSTLAFADARHGWLVLAPAPGATASRSSILATSDGGRTWVTQAQVPAVLDGVDFVDASHGWVVAGSVQAGGGASQVYGAALLRTVDGGTHWVEAGEPPDPLARVDFVDASHGWGITYSDQLVRTLNGGGSWQPVSVGSTGLPLSAVCFSSATEGWVAGPGTPGGTQAGEVLHSTDGGRTWSVSFTGSSQWGTQSTQLGCAGTSAWALFGLSPGAGQLPSIIERTADDGAGWTPVLTSTSGSQLPLSQVGHPGPFDVIDAQAAVFSSACPMCAAPQASVVATGDGGSSAQVHALPGSGSRVAGLSFLDARVGWVAVSGPPGSRGPDGPMQVLATTDGGQTWSLQYRAPSS